MSDGPSYAQLIIATYPRLLVESYCIIASSALLWFDFALTFPEEYRRIWKRKFTGATLVYLLMRYIAVIERIFFVLEVLVWKSSDSTCGGITHTDDALLFLNYLAFAAFTSLRVYGVWGRDWKPLAIVLPLSLIKPIGVLWENTRYIPAQGGPPFGCLYLYEISDATLSHISIASKAGTIAADGILIVLTWIKTFGIKRDSLQTGVRTPLATLLLRDGTAYFLVLLVIQLVTIISNQIGHSLTIWLVWPYFDQVFTVIFLSRFMLDLRGLYFADRGGQEAETTLHMSDVKFHGLTQVSARVVGNFGATLNTTLMFSADPDLPSPDSDDYPAAAERRRERLWDDEDELPEYCEDPFKAGLTDPDPARPPALVSEVAEEGEDPEKERGFSGMQFSVQEEARGDVPPV